MASANKFLIRCQTEKGSFLINHVNSETAVGELKMYLSLEMDLKPESIKILRGYPPRALDQGIDYMTLKNVNIQTGETIFIEKNPETLEEYSSFQDFPLRFSAEVTGGGFADSFNPSSSDDISGGSMVRHVVDELAEGIDNLTLNDVNIQSGETIIIEKHPKKLEDGSNFRDKPSNVVDGSSCGTVMNHMVSCNKDFIIRCKTEKGSFVLKHLNSMSTVGELKIYLSQVMDLKPESMKIFYGHPPRELAEDSDNLTLNNVNIQSRDTIILAKACKSFQDFPLSRNSNEVIGVASGDSVNQPNALEGLSGDIMDRHVVPANKEFIIRCKTEKGSFLIKHLKCESTVKDLKMYLNQVIDLKPESIKILHGYPPRALEDSSDNLTLQNVNIHSGDSTILRIYRKMLEDITCEGIMMRHKVPSNKGSCLFSSIYFAIHKGNFNFKKINKLRKVIAYVVSGNPKKYNFGLLGMSNKEYCSWIQNTRHWGGAIELEILSQHFGTEIAAVDIFSLKIHRFGENANYSSRIFLMYNGAHYDPLVLKSENGILQTTFPASDDRPMKMALEIAREAKCSSQYKNGGILFLRCMVCHEKVRGEEEARAHSLSSGHHEFCEFP